MDTMPAYDKFGLIVKYPSSVLCRGNLGTSVACPTELVLSKCAALACVLWGTAVTTFKRRTPDTGSSARQSGRYAAESGDNSPGFEEISRTNRANSAATFLLSLSGGHSSENVYAFANENPVNQATFQACHETFTGEILGQWVKYVGES